MNMATTEQGTGATATLSGTGAMHADLRKGERNIEFTRMFDAPREKVFRAWTDPQLLAQWWGPSGFTNPVCDLDVRPGGEYHIVMRSPDGVEYPVRGRYLEIASPEKLVYTDTFQGMPEEWLAELNKHRPLESNAVPEDLVMTVLFDEIQGMTQLSIWTFCGSVADCNAIMKIGAADGWSQSMDRLDQLLGRI
jgi:uncharacterized protein YndB with AHSA1/START domain